MEIVKYLISQFVNEYLFEVILLIIISLVGSILTTNVITHFNSMLITSVQGGQLDTTIMFFKYFMYSRIAFALFTYGYKLVQDVIMTNLKQWIVLKIYNG